MKTKSALHSFLTIAGSSLLAVSSSSAQAIFWDGATTGQWGLNTNWSTDLVPTSSNDVTILGPGNAAGALTLNTQVNMSVNSINFTNTAATNFQNNLANFSGNGRTIDIGAGGLTTGTGSVAIGINQNNGINTRVTAAQTWNVGAGGLTLNNVNQGAFTITKTGTGTLTYIAGFGNGSLGFEGGLIVNAGLVNVNFVNWSSTSVSLINSTAAQTLGGGNLTFTGRSATASIQALGAITTTGGSSTLSLVATGTGRMTVTAASFGYTAGNAVALVNGTELGKDSTDTSAVSRLILTSAPTLVGTTAATSTGINSTFDNTVIVPYLVGEAATGGGGLGTALGTANTFLTYHATTGLRPLNQTDEFTSNAYTSGNNTRITSATAANATTAINSLLVTSGAASAVSITNGSTLTVTSGAVLFTSTGATVTGTATNILGFGGAQAQISTNSGVTATISAQISGSGGLNKSGAGTLILSGANSYSGGVSLAAGTLQLGSTGALNSTAGSENAVTFSPNSPATLALAGNSVTIANLSTNNTTPGTNFVQNANGSAVGNATLTVGNSTNASGTYAGTMRDGTGGGTLALTKAGAGTLTLTGTNTYTGATNITGGSLAITGSGSIASSPLINISTSTTLNVTGVTGSFTLGATQTVAGNGTILATGKTVVVNGTLAPGASPGTLTQDGGTLQLGIGGDYNWQIHDATGAAGTGYDTTNLINGATLDLSLLSAGNTYNINLWSLSGISPDVNGNATNFNNALTQSWTLFSTGTAISGFSTDKFTINTGTFNGTSGFTNALGGGAFSVGLADSNTDIVLTFTAVPEPRAALLGAIGTLALLRRRRTV